MRAFPDPALSAIEMIFNRLRLKYLRAIALSPALRDSPATAISHRFNGAFLSLAGVKVVQPVGTPPRANDWFWEQQGFDPRAKHELDWDQDHRNLASAIRDLVQHSGPTVTVPYAELIAMKPGFHEAWLHDEFPHDVHEGPEAPRGRIFAILRGSHLPLIDLHGAFPADFTEPDEFLGYAPCVVTEGPMVRRLRPDVSYFAELKRVGEMPTFKERRDILRDSFEVLDTWQWLQDENNAAALDRLIEAAGTRFHCF